jgi:hypothetical protein
MNAGRILPELSFRSTIEHAWLAVLQPAPMPPLDPALGLSASIGAPAGACPNCWRAWLVRPRDAIGYCWHGKVAWRVKSGALAVAPEVTRDEYHAMAEYITEMESVMRPTKSRAACAASAER